jgi:hypothetical protein
VVATGPAQWVSVPPPPGASSAVRRVTPRPDGALEIERESTFTDRVRDGQVLDDYIIWSTAKDDVTTINCQFNRVDVASNEVGPSSKPKGRATVIDGGTHLTWQLSFTDSSGHVTRQAGATVLNADGSGAQSVTTTRSDDSGTQEHIQWTDVANATRRTETSDADNNTRVDTGVVSSTDCGAWAAVAASPIRYNDPSQDLIPPPYGPRGPVFGGDVIDMTAPPPSTSPGS